MQAAIDPFQPLLRLVDRYRHDVHTLHAPAPAEALDGARVALGHPLPAGLRGFLERWNGAELFRGALRLRTADELASAAADAREVIVFAEGPAPDDHWAYAPGPDGATVFGRWVPEGADGGGVFEPLHPRFDRWLFATLRILDEALRDAPGQLAARLAVDPDNGFLLLQEAERVLAGGDPDAARGLLARATAAEPGLVGAWERLGDCLLGEDRPAARFAYLKALRAVRLPARVPLANAPGAELVRALHRLFPAGDEGWERELDAFLAENVKDATATREVRMVEAAAVCLARTRIQRGARPLARAGLQATVDRLRAVRGAAPAHEALLLLARTEAELGEHDAAETRLRGFRDAPGAWPARALLELSRIAVARQEPWAEEMLAEAREGLAPRAGEPAEARLGDRADALLLLAERHRAWDRRDDATVALQEAAALAGRARDRLLLARCALLEGDLALDAGDAGAAARAWDHAWALAETDAEPRERVRVRRGELAAAAGDRAEAVALQTEAAQGFAALHLPLQEAWTLLRLGRHGVPGALDRARALFRAADLAAGVAAADALAGDTGRSLDWHLDRAAEHARDRANAQRARPPLTRADADRPERRLGAHRMAIAACDARVVGALDRTLQQSLGRLDGGFAIRSADPTLTAALAAVDLLSGHRSYEAAEVLLRLLLHERPGGVAARVLVGALARSPNAAVVDGLLTALDAAVDPGGIALAAEVLGLRREPAAVATLRSLLASPASPTVRRAAVEALGRIGDPACIDDLLLTLDEPELAGEAATALLLLGDWQGVDSQAQALASRRSTQARHLGEIVGRYGGPAYLLLLYRAADEEGPTGLGAIAGLGWMGDPRGVDRLLDLCGVRDPVRARTAHAALELLTGHTEDPDESLLRNRWAEWWAAHKDAFTPGVRYRHGQLYDPGRLLQRLDHDDAQIRRSTYDELVITTGCHLPFDAEGPWRVQRAHRAAWAAWWAQQAERFPAGRWCFQGERIG